MTLFWTLVHLIYMCYLNTRMSFVRSPYAIRDAFGMLHVVVGHNATYTFLYVHGLVD